MSDFELFSVGAGFGDKPDLSRKELRRARRFLRNHAFSANLVVDLQAAQTVLTLGIGGTGSGLIYAASGAVIGAIADMRDSDTFCNVVAMGNAVFTSGMLRLVVQTSDDTTSGNFTDPTSGRVAGTFPTTFSSGGILIINRSGLSGGIFGNFISGESIQSGWVAKGGFIRVGRYARVNVMSGDFYAGTLTVALLSQQKTTGSGAGFTFSPSSGSVVV